MKKYLKSEERGMPRVFAVSLVSEFVELATWVYSSQNVIFRGQTKEVGWPLVPAVGRFLEGSRIPWREREILDEFKREAIPYLHVIPRNDWQWLAIAQHNRLPTRLLDWTRNPLTALWFAVSEPAIDARPGVVWALSCEKADVVFKSEGERDPFSIDRPYIYFPEHVFSFIQAQSCVFTVHKRDNDNPGKFPPLEEIKDADLRLTKIEIPPDSFPTVRYHLFRVGISPASMFPGLQGLVDRIRYDNMLSDDEQTIGWPPNTTAGAVG